MFPIPWEHGNLFITSKDWSLYWVQTHNFSTHSAHTVVRTEVASVWHQEPHHKHHCTHTFYYTCLRQRNRVHMEMCSSCSCIQMDLDGVVTFVVGWIQGKCTKSSVYSSSKVCLLASVPDLLDTHRWCLADAEVPWTHLAVWKIPTIKTKVFLQWKPLPGQVEMLSHLALKRIQAKLAQSLHKSEQLQLPLKFMWVTLTYFRFELSQCPCYNSHSNVLLFSAHFTLSTCFDFKAAKSFHFIESQNQRTIKVGRDNWVPPLTHPAALYSRDETHENSVSNILWSSCLAKMVAYVIWTYTHPNPALSNCSRKILDGFDSYFL